MAKYSSGAPDLIDKNMFKISDNKKRLMTTETNMMPEFFANTDKLIDSDKRVYYDKTTKNNTLDDIDDNIEQYAYSSKPMNQSNVPNMSMPQNSHTQHQQSPLDDKSDKNNECETRKNDPDDESTWDKETLMFKKLEMMKKLGELVQCGVTLTQNYGLKSEYSTMKMEYELHSGIRNKQNGIQLMSGIMYSIVKGIEMLNDNYNPFDIKFDRVWSNQVGGNINNYYDVLGEIYEKYTSSGKKMAPELKLLGMLACSAVMIQMNKGISNMIPNASKTIDDDPELIKELRKKADTQVQKNDDALKERMMAEHNAATAMAKDYQFMKKSEMEYKKMEEQAEQMSQMERMKNQYVLSESSMTKVQQQYQPKANQNTTRITKLSDQSINNYTDISEKKQNLLMQQQELVDMQNILEQMQNEEHYVAENKQNIPQPKQSKQKQTVKSLLRNIDSQSNASTSMSAVSTVSTISVNPNKNQILGYGKNKTNISVLKVINKSDVDFCNPVYDAISFGSGSNSNGGKGGKKGGIVIGKK